jgi:hypothetical protein
MNLRSNSSQILIADAHHQPKKERETFSIMKERELRLSKKERDERFTPSGNNIIPAGAGRVGPSKVDQHPPAYYKANRLSSKA